MKCPSSALFGLAAACLVLVSPPLQTASAIGNPTTSAPSEPVAVGAVTPSVTGTIEGALAVGPDGSASYSVPLQLPEGVGGTAPELALAYNSMNVANGLVGIGWSLSGISSIQRCGTQAYRDGTRHAVNFTTRDRLCLDGQRLIHLRGSSSDADYWRDGQEYRTDPETYRRVRMVGSCAATAECTFTVEDGRGSKRVYGATRVTAGRHTESWLLTSESDRNANTIKYEWQVADGAAAPSTISYGPHTIEFAYTNRDSNPADVPEYYRHGYRRAQHSLLASVSVRTDNTTFRVYRLDYQISAATGRSRLATLRQCDGAGTCLEPTLFTYYGGTRRDALFRPRGTISDVGNDDRALLRFGDFNGDGSTDILRQGRSRSGVPGMTIYQTADSGDFSKIAYCGFWFDEALRFGDGAHLHVADFDGDGVSDFARQEHGAFDDDAVGSFQVYFANRANTTFRVVTPDDSAYQNLLRADPGVDLIPGDYDGDGRADLVRLEHGSWDDDDAYSFGVYFSRGDGTFRWVFPSGPGYQEFLKGDGGTQIYPGDFNGDGKTDFLSRQINGWGADYSYNFRVYLSRGDGYFDWTEPGTNQPGDPYQHHLRDDGGVNLILGDYNGDGLTDFVRQEKGGWDNDENSSFNVYFSAGDGTFSIVTPTGWEYQNLLRADPGAILTPGDFNGDGKTDLVRQERGSWTGDTINSFSIYYSRGNGYFDIARADTDEYQAGLRYDVGTAKGVLIHVADFDGDGRADFFSQPRLGAAGQGKLYLNDLDGPPEHLLRVVQKGDLDRETLTYTRYSNVDMSIPPAGTAMLAPAGFWVVKSQQQGVGSTGELQRLYTYSEAVFDSSGRGFLGFQQVAIETPQAGLVQELRVRTDVPFQQRIASSTTKLSSTGEVLESTQLDYLALSGGILLDASRNTPPVVLAAKTTTLFPGAGSQTERLDYTYDDAGNVVLTGRTDVTRGDSTYTCTKYRRDLSSWNLVSPSDIFTSSSCTLDSTGDCSCATPVLQISHLDYDERGNLVSNKDWDSSLSTWVGDTLKWDNLGRLSWKLSASGARQTLGYASDTSPYPGFSIAGTSELKLTTKLKFDPRFGQLLEHQDPNGAVRRQVLDTFGRVVEHNADDENGLQYRTTKRFYREGNRYVVETSSTEGAGMLVRREYSDHLGHVWRRDEPGPSTTERIYTDTIFNVLGQVKQQSAPYLSSTTPRFRSFEYDGAGRPVRVVESDGRETKLSYASAEPCAKGESAITTTLPGGRTQVECQDLRGSTTRRAFAFEAGAPQTRLEHDALGRLFWSELTSEGKSQSNTRTTYDTLGRVSREVSSQQGRTDYEFNALGQLIRKRAAGGLSVEGDTDRPGGDYRVIPTGDPNWCKTGCAAEAQCLAYTWMPDSSGGGYCHLKDQRPAPSPVPSVASGLHRAVSVTSEKSTVPMMVSGVRATADAVTTYTYDALGRIATQELSDGSVRTYAYDQGPNGLGRLARVELKDESNVILAARSLSYDVQGRVAAETLETGGRSYTQSYKYFVDGSAQAVVYPDGSELTYEYDQAGRVARLRLDGTEYVAYPSYAPSGQPKAIEYANGVSTTMSYDEVDRLGRIDTTGPEAENAASPLMSRKLGWNGTDEIVSIEDLLDASRSQIFQYNQLGFLSQADGPYGVERYRYDGAGNLLQKGDVNFIYSSQQLTGTSRGDRFVVDGRGRRISKTGSSGSTLTYEYDGEEHLRQVTKDGISVEQYGYGETGDRLTRVDAKGNRTIYVSSLYEVTVLASGTELHTKYIPGLNGRTAAVTLQAATSSTAGGFAGTSLRSWWSSDATSTDHVALDAPRSKVELQMREAWLWLFGATALGLMALVATSASRGRGSRRQRPRGPVGSRTARPGSGLTGYKPWVKWPMPLVVPSFLAATLTSCTLGPETLVIAGGDYQVELLENGLAYAPIHEGLLPGENGAGYPTVGTYFFHQDQIGSTNLITDAKGQPVTEAQHLPYGALSLAGSSGVDLYRAKFTGKEWDSDAGLYYFNARYYDPAVGRFIQADTEEFGSAAEATAVDLNRYAYARNNPITYTDPSGHFFWFVAFIAFSTVAGAGVGGGISLAQADQAAVSQGTQLTGAERAAAFWRGAAGGAAGGAVAAVGTALVVALVGALGVTGLSAMAATAAGEGIAGFASGFLGDVATQVAGGRSVDWGQAATSGLIGAGTGAVLGGLGAGMRQAGTGAAKGVGSGCPGGKCATQAGFCFVEGTTVATQGGQVAIENLRVGERVLTIGETQSSATDVDPRSWRLVRLEMPNPHASQDVLEIELLRPLAWLTLNQASEGQEIDFVLEDMGIEGRARVVGMEACPRVAEGPGRVVLATFTHRADDVLELRFEGSTKPLEPTAGHRIFSADRGAWVPARDLRVGEQVATASGTARLESARPKPGLHRVFNMEVETRHSFLASELEVLSHNADCGRNGAFREAKRDLGIRMDQHPTRVDKVAMTTSSGERVVHNQQDVMTREYHFTRPDKEQGWQNETVVIQEHSAGHRYGPPGTAGNQGPHFNVRPSANTRTGRVPGTRDHYPFVR